MFNLDIYTIIARVIVLLVAFTIHELAHALTADYLGDPTPRRMGRITLNPLKHLDPFGTIMLIIAGFGWAKPVMVNPMNMRGNPRTSMAIVAIAGPLSNLVMAAMAAIFFRLGLVDMNSLFLGNASSLSFANLLIQFLYINLASGVLQSHPGSAIGRLKNPLCHPAAGTRLSLAASGTIRVYDSLHGRLSRAPGIEFLGLASRRGHGSTSSRLV